MLPLVRVVVQYKDSRQGFNCIKFSQRFADKIANPSDAVLLKFFRGDRINRRSGTTRDSDDVRFI